jgi:hypothetical protein
VSTSAIGQEFGDQRFRRGKAIRYGLVIGLLGYLLGSMVSEVVTGVVVVYMVAVVVLIGFLAIGLVRSFRVGIRLTDEGVEARTTYSTKTWPWGVIERARAHDRSVRVSPYVAGVAHMVNSDDRVKTYPMLDLTNGRDARMYGLQMTVREPESSAWIDDAVTAINQIVAARRGETDPSAPRPT